MLYTLTLLAACIVRFAELVKCSECAVLFDPVRCMWYAKPSTASDESITPLSYLGSPFWIDYCLARLYKVSVFRFRK